jgi:hypothetical protein
MIAADRTEQAEPAADPQAGDPPPLADLIAASADELRREVIALRAKVERLEKPPRRWMGLKAAARHEGVRYETLRKWCAKGQIVAKREGGRILVDLFSLRDFLGRSRDF